jgi:hypothetical protein
MSTVNFNDTTPAAPANTNNIHFQSDASGNISANDSYGAWQTWTPTVLNSGTMTISAFTVFVARYLRLGPVVHFYCALQFTIGGTAGQDITFSAPVPYTGPNPVPFSANGNQPTPVVQENYLGFITATGLLTRRNNQTSWVLGTGASVNITGTYQCG